MKFVLAVAVLLIASVLPAGAQTAAAQTAAAQTAGAQTAAGAQPLTISVSGDGAQATRLASYVPDVPIAVTVTKTGSTRIDSMAIAASGPDGQVTNLPLARAADGTFTGWLALRTQGIWRLLLTSRAGASSTETTPIALDVRPPQPSDAGLIGLLVGGAMFLVVGGGGFVLLRRRLSDASPAELQHASRRSAVA